MQPGDFVLTPGWTWHDHGHLGSEPVIWLDALDNPFGQFFGAIFRENYPEEAQAPSLADGRRRGALRLQPDAGRIPLRPALVAAAGLSLRPHARGARTAWRNGPLHPAHGVKMRYANPLNGGYVYPTIAVFIQWLPKGFSGQTYRSTDGTVFTVVEGSGRAHIGDVRHSHLSRTTCSWCRRGRPITSTTDKRMRAVQPFRPRRAGSARLLARARPVASENSVCLTRDRVRIRT